MNKLEEIKRKTKQATIKNNSETKKKKFLEHIIFENKCENKISVLPYNEFRGK